MATTTRRKAAPPIQRVLSEVPENTDVYHDDFPKGETAEDRQQLEANNMIYQVIRDHKQREHEKQMSVLRDAQSITETMTQKRREADENRSVVTASFSYANNLRYVSINSGGDPRILLGI